MIRLKDIPEPNFRQSDEVKAALRKAKDDIAAEVKKLKLPALWSENDELRDALHKRHYEGKCCYCERKRDKKLERDVEHYRPKKAVTVKENGKDKAIEGHKGYWWVAYDWDNLLIACKTCNTGHKMNLFPLLDEKNRVFEEGDLSQEEPMLLNPALEDPERYIAYHYEEANNLSKIAFPIPSQEDTNGRGEMTIEIAKLNRDDLMGVDHRAGCIDALRTLVDDYNHYSRLRDMGRLYDNEKQEKSAEARLMTISQDIRDKMSPYEEYAGFRRYFIRQNHLEHLIP